MSDCPGNAIIIASSTAVRLALTYGGARHPWSSWRVIVPMVLGLVGLVFFALYESLSSVKQPVMPPRLFKNRTSAAVMVITFFNSMLLVWAMYFLSIYFQTVQTSSPQRSGVQLLPLVLVAVPGAIVTVVVLTKFGRYRPLHHVSFAITTLGTGLFTLLTSTSSPAEWIVFQMIAGLGAGIVLNTLLPACQAPLAESDQVAATATWAFIRNFGSIWGVAIPAAIFNSRCNALAYHVSDPTARAALANGQAYQHATSSFVDFYRSPARTSHRHLHR
jgi:Fungal trichothecene efflux pump (TRI12)